MDESIMYFAIGFLAAALSLLVVVPLVHGRAVRLATRRLEDAIPPSVAELLADKDVLRAKSPTLARRLEIMVEEFKTSSTSQLAELARREAETNQLKLELGALRDQLRATEEQCAANAIAVQQTERALSDKELELAQAMGQLDERSTLANVQRTEISALEIQVETLNEALDGSRFKLKAVEGSRDAERMEFEATAQNLMDARRQAERALSDKQSQIAQLLRQLNERSILAHTQKVEIIAFETQVEAMKQSLEGARNELKALEDRQDAERMELHAATQKLMEDRLEAARALSDKESELARLMGEVKERSSLGDAQRAEIVALKTEVEAMEQALDETRSELKAIEVRRDAERMELEVAIDDAERNLCAKESDLAEANAKLDERSVLADAQKSEIRALKAHVEALQEALDGSRNEFKAAEDRRDAERLELEAAAQKLMDERQEAERALSAKKSELAQLTVQLDARSTLADAQMAEIVTLKTDIETMKQALEEATTELTAIKDCRGPERIEDEGAAEKLMEERGEFEQFKRRVAELVQQLMAQTAEDKIRAEDLENRLIEQSRLLEESAANLGHLRGEIEIACRAEADLRNTIIEIEGRANTAIQNLKSESAKLQAALDRANGERMRLTHEVAKLKRQAEENWAA
jgi:chromosome segregation ATPase